MAYTVKLDGTIIADTPGEAVAIALELVKLNNARRPTGRRGRPLKLPDDFDATMGALMAASPPPSDKKRK